MASTIILSDNGASSGSAGLKTTAGDDGVLILKTTTSGGTATNAVYVDTAQQVGIGVTPSAWLTSYSNKAIQVGPVGSIYSNSVNSSNKQMAVSSNTYLDSGAATKYIADGHASTYIQYGGNHVFSSAASGTAGGTVTFADVLSIGKATTLVLEGGASSSGTGIAFPATQSASSNANTLDDYEEGTWTPTLGGSSSDPTATYNTQTGYYTKIGRQVTIYYYLYPATYSGGSGTLYIKGVPFTNGAANVVGSVYTSAVNWSTKTMALSYMPTTATFVRTICTVSNAGDYDVQCNDVSAGDVIIGSITYFV